MEIAYVGVGLGVGLMIGLTGIGGGSFMTPILVLGFGVPVSVAVGTDLIYASLTKISAIVGYARNKSVRWDVVRALLYGSIPGALVVIGLLRVMGPAGDATAAIKVGLGFAVMFTAMLLMFKRQIQAVARGERAPRLKDLIKLWRPQITVAAGFVLGALVALTSVGAGAVGTATLIMLYPGMALPTMIGTEIAHAVVLTAVAGIGHVSQGNINYSLLLSLLIGSLPGAFIGTHLGLRLPDRIIRPVMAVFLFYLGSKLVF